MCRWIFTALVSLMMKDDIYFDLRRKLGWKNGGQTFIPSLWWFLKNTGGGGSSQEA